MKNILNANYIKTAEGQITIHAQNWDYLTAGSSLINIRIFMKQNKTLTAQQWEAIFDAITDMVFLLSPDHTILMANQAAQNGLNLTLDKLIGHFCFCVVHNQDYPIQECPCEKTLKTRSPQFNEYESQGRNYLLSAWPIFSETGEIEAIIHTVRDITAQKQAEAQLILAESEWEETFNTISDMITVHDKDFNIIRANRAATKLLKLPLLDLMPGVKCFKYYHGTEVPHEGCQSCNCLQTGLPATFEVFEPHLNMFIEIRAIPRFDSQKKLSGLIHVIRDITERKKTEEALVQAKEKAQESDRLKSAFLLNLSHEIRTPMNGILGFAQLLKEPHLTFGEQKKFIQHIEKSSARMLNIITAIVNISKIESGQMEISVSEINVNEKIEFVYNFFKPEVEQKGVQFLVKSTLSSKEAVIRSDSGKILSILNNLVDNAVKFTHTGSIEFGYEKKGKYLEFFIKDTGDGIPEEKQDFIFERFRQGSESMTRNYEGAGLGLSIAKAYVEMLGGKIWLESEPGKGSAFYLTIPYNAETEPEIVNKDISSGIRADSQIENLKILIAEDDESSEFFLSTALKMYIKELFQARNGVEAVEACRNNPDIDLVLMDIRMPDMNGYEATRQIRQFNKDVVIIAQTAHGLSGDREKAIEAGCNDYISKPIDITLLKAIIRKYFKK
ncbi:MAG: response regulator [Bacteroidetes bacterium]|nr:MAG: response regulator [Bacteroidota bacterium]